MNSPAWVPWLIGGMAVALAVVSAVAGTLWGRVRSVPLWQVAQLARELAERQRALEDLLLRLERGARPRAGAVEVPDRPSLGARESSTRGDGDVAGSRSVPPLSPSVTHEGGGDHPARRVSEVDGHATTPTLAPSLRGEGGSKSSSPRREDRAHTTPPGPTLIAVPDLSTVATRDAIPSVSDEWQRRHGAVWELADAGARAEQIATHMGLPIGHVELILGLRKPLTTGGGSR